MTKKIVSFSGINRVTPSVTAPDDTNLSDATGHDVSVEKRCIIKLSYHYVTFIIIFV